MQDKIKPIETIYKGCRFRSRLEARWAVFFDNLGIEWRYEAEGYQMANHWWLPDFWLPGLEVIVEIKPTKEEADTFRDKIFTHDPLGCPTYSIPGLPIVAWGDIPDPDDLPLNHIAVPWDDEYEFCVCDLCGTVGIEYESRSGRINCGCPDPGDSRQRERHPRVLAAYAAARSARFEHGESGAPR